MLQLSRLSCSCQEATVSRPPSLYGVPLFPPVGEQAASSMVPMPATASSRNERGLAPLMRPPSEFSRADQRRTRGRGAPADNAPRYHRGAPKKPKKNPSFSYFLPHPAPPPPH